MNENEIERIAAAVNQLRPDWPTASLRTLLGRPELVNRPRRDVAVALSWVACEAESKTPARVLGAGPWWQATSVEGGTSPRPAPFGERCRHCTMTRDHCFGEDHVFLSNDDYNTGRRIAESDGPIPRGPFANVSHDALVVAASLRAEMERLRCEHGIDVRKCDEEHASCHHGRALQLTCGKCVMERTA